MGAKRIAAFIAASMVTGSCLAEEPKKIEDNSFLIEEAYNQEEGVVQHINTLLYDRRSKEWLYTFTQEWPMWSQLHQFSYTVPVTRTGDPLSTGLGDVALNYRYQAVLQERLAISPRVSLITPTGNYRKGRGNGATGVQVLVPVSIAVSDTIVTHLNVGATHTPRARATDGSRATTNSTTYGGSVIYLASPIFNWMLEVVSYDDQTVEEGGARKRERTTLVSPGFRYAVNHVSGAQTALGFALPQGVGSGQKTRGIFLYYSFEHPFL